MNTFIYPEVAQSQNKANIFEALVYLAENLEQIIGYPVEVASCEQLQDEFTGTDELKCITRLQAMQQDIGCLVYSKALTHDPFSQQCINLFAHQCEAYLSSFFETPERLSVSLINDVFSFWDEFICLLTLDNENASESSKIWLLQMLSTLRQVLHYKYEGNQTTFGILCSKNLEQLQNKSKLDTLVVREYTSLNTLLKHHKGFSLISDAESAIISINEKTNQAYLLFGRPLTGKTAEGWELLPRKFQWIPPLLLEHDVVLINTINGEQFLITQTYALKWSLRGWSRLTTRVMLDELVNIISLEAARIMIRIIADLSDARTGALLIFWDMRVHTHLSEIYHPGVLNQFEGDYLFDITSKTQNLIKQLCHMDGATLINENGQVVDAGVMIKRGVNEKGKGARSAAAGKASQYGIAIHISEDGPITIYKLGKKLYTFN